MGWRPDLGGWRHRGWATGVPDGQGPV